MRSTGKNENAYISFFLDSVHIPRSSFRPPLQLRASVCLSLTAEENGHFRRSLSHKEKSRTSRTERVEPNEATRTRLHRCRPDVHALQLAVFLMTGTIKKNRRERREGMLAFGHFAAIYCSETKTLLSITVGSVRDISE